MVYKAVSNKAVYSPPPLAILISQESPIKAPISKCLTYIQFKNLGFDNDKKDKEWDKNPFNPILIESER